MSIILIVEDEPKIAKLQKEYLEREGYVCHIIDDGNEVTEWVRANSPQLIILDIGLPSKDGLTVCKEIRAFSSVPILMLTARVEEIDRILGLELGGDDYICKPVSPNEVVARVRANLRRVELEGGNAKAASFVARASPITFDENLYQAWLQGQSLQLTAIEFQLLVTLVKQAGRVYSREQLMQNIYSDSRIVSDKTIDSHVKKIRKKLHEIDADIEWIHSVYGVGFKYEY